MQKVYCDLCGGEIKLNTLGGGIMRNRETFPVLPMPPMGPREGPGQMIQKRIMQEVWDLCEECQKWIWGQVENRKTGLLKEKK